MAVLRHPQSLTSTKIVTEVKMSDQNSIIMGSEPLSELNINDIRKWLS